MTVVALGRVLVDWAPISTGVRPFPGPSGTATVAGTVHAVDDARAERRRDDRGDS